MQTPWSRACRPGYCEERGYDVDVIAVHQWSGVTFPVPVLIGLGSRAVRADLGLLSRFGPQDRHWLRAARSISVADGRLADSLRTIVPW
ncbi:hypothetical protein ACH4D3_40545 [Streptomyces sp. NPDC018026]|uniref:hypothetical protein n=1 Tax=Streptomyces sp. NPDC018026 TaxID=3365031 RepID=UPI00379D9013